MDDTAVLLTTNLTNEELISRVHTSMASTPLERLLAARLEEAEGEVEYWEGRQPCEVCAACDACGE